MLHRLADTLTPAEVVAFEKTTGMAETALIGAIARHQIVDLLEERGPLDAAAIAAARGLDADAVHRALRGLVATGVFAMDAGGRFANNRISRALRSGSQERTREWALHFASGSNAAAWLDCARTLETGRRRRASGCDAYIIENVLHDWDDATCKKILGVVRAAMSPGQRLVLCEILVDRLARDTYGTRVDLQMMIACDQGRERSEAELRALLTDCGFRTTRVFPFPIVSVLEAEPV